MPTDERVLCIPSEHFHAIGAFHGFRKADADYQARLLNPAAFSFRPRREVETDPTFKQLIPYVILTCGEQVFHYRRGESGTEKRLQSLRSLGIGGHISEEDAFGDGDPYRIGMLRELSEEVNIDTDYTEEILGFISDARTLVGSVHLGVVHRLELREPRVTAREAALAEAGFATRTDVQQWYEQFETWSQFVMKEMME